MKNAVTVFLLSSLLALIPACKQRESATDTAVSDLTATTDTASATHPGSPGGTAIVPDVTAGTTLVVLVQEGSVAVQAQSIPAGPAILTIENRGTEVHNLFVEGEGINRAAEDTIGAGQTGTLDVNLKAGTYTFYCPIGDHRTKGEEAKVVVGTASDTPATGTDTGATSTTATATTGS
jgi:plastocyanin